MDFQYLLKFDWSQINKHSFVFRFLEASLLPS
jgi:hypothetical protein